MSSSNPKQNNKQDAVPSRETSGSVLHDPFPDLSNYAARSPKSTKDAVRSPERAKKNTFFENDYLNGE